MKRTTPTEAQEQQKLFDWAALQSKRHSELELLHHIPNGGSRNKAEATNLKRQGVKPGVSDVFLPVARGEYHGLYIELKALYRLKEKGLGISDEQSEWACRVVEQGYYACFAYGAEDAKSVIEWYLSLPAQKLR